MLIKRMWELICQTGAWELKYPGGVTVRNGVGSFIAGAKVWHSDFTSNRTVVLYPQPKHQIICKKLCLCVQAELFHTFV